MALMDKGRVCVITKGADAGKHAVVKEVIDKNFVIITGEKLKERKSNIKHLEPINKTQAVPKGKEIKQKEKKPQEKKKTAAKKQKKPKAAKK